MIDLSRLTINKLPYLTGVRKLTDSDRALTLLGDAIHLFSISFIEQDDLIQISYNNMYMDSASNIIIKNCSINVLTFLYKLDHLELRRAIKYYLTHSRGIRQQLKNGYHHKIVGGMKDSIVYLTEEEKTFIMSIVLGND